jgi:DNA-binding response OmpR family regulator
VKTRLLMADTDGASAGLARAYLTHAGFQVEMAANTSECLSKLRARSPDLLLLDWALPGGGGNEILAELRTADGPRVPVVMMAEMMPFNALSNLRKPPVVRCIRRPIRIAALCDCLNSVLRPQRWSRPSQPRSHD